MKKKPPSDYKGFVLLIWILTIISVSASFYDSARASACPLNDEYCLPTYHPKTKAGQIRQARRGYRVEERLSALLKRYDKYCDGRPRAFFSPFISDPYKTVGKCFFVQFDPISETIGNNIAIVKYYADPDIPPIAVYFKNGLPPPGTLLNGVMVGTSVKKFINQYRQEVVLQEFAWSHYADISKIGQLENRITEIYSEKPLTRKQELDHEIKLFSQEVNTNISRFLSLSGPLQNGCHAIVKLSRWGNVIAGPKLISCGNNGVVKKAIKNAILKCGPFYPVQGLPYSKYKTLVINFN
jgi:hypothetical protein